MGSPEGIKARQDIWDYNILSVLTLVLKQDFSIVDGDWQTAAAIAAIIRFVYVANFLPSLVCKFTIIRYFIISYEKY